MHKKNGLVEIIAAAMTLGFLAGCATLAPEARREQAETIIRHWSDPSRLTAAKLIEEYGPPDEARYGRLIWDRKGPWAKTMVWDVAADELKRGTPDFIEQTVSFSVPATMEPALAAFSDRVRVDEKGGRFSVRSDSEEKNFLTANLVYEVVAGIKNPAQAARFYEETIRFALAGKSSPYMQTLLFLPRP
ncbi:MAG TPA: hypothetical protein DEB40_13620 [Elusimicrobia bacterium]|nr:hypothetical protein [Elusimicrobiota bacterium]HBT62773.1 hypothetical protein [Elusimicrobiota bacterium]